TFPPASAKSVEAFASLLSHSGLMSQDDINSFLEKSVPPDVTISSAEDLSEYLVRKQKLTEFQAEWLQQGKTEGLVLGNYVVLDKLGAGGMGVVFKAQHRRMKRTVALKVLPEAIAKSPDAINRFHREVEAAAKLQHPNIAAAFDADDDKGVHFLVMEYVDGPNLSAYLKQEGPLPLPYALALTLQTAYGLAHAHSQGVVHRDIKPGNLMVDSHGTLKILDMGLAQLAREATDEDITEITQSGRMMGTVDYMAPEQAVDAKTADARADIYSLGCTFFHLAVGRPLAPEGSITQKLLWHQNEPLPPLSAALPGATESVCAAIHKMLAKQADDRQSSMLEVIADLEAALAEISANQQGQDQTLQLAGPISAVSLRPSASGYPSMTESSTVTSYRAAMQPASHAAAANTNSPSRTLIYAMLGVAALLGIVGLVIWRFVGAETVQGDPPVVVRDPDTTNTGGETTPRPNIDPRGGLVDGGQSVGGGAADPGDGGDDLKGGAAATPEQQRRQLLQWIFDNGGSVTVLTADGVAPRPVARLSELPEGSIYSVMLDDSVATDNELAGLAQLTEMQELMLPGTNLSDRGLAQLAALANVSLLDVSGTAITDAGVVALQPLKKLRELRLARTEISDAAMIYLADLPRLEKLDLSDTAVTDVGLKKLADLGSLRYLMLNGAEITEPGFRQLAAALPRAEIIWNGPDTERMIARDLLDAGAVIGIVEPGDGSPTLVERKADLPQRRFQIASVDLRGKATFADHNLEPLVQLSELSELKLEGTSVTDAGVARLGDVNSLERLELGTLPLSEETLGALERKLPGLKIEQQVTNERVTAEWALAGGGFVSVVTPEGELPGLSAVEQLPRGPFKLTKLSLADAESVTDDDLAKLRGLAGLEALHLNGTGVTDAGLVHLIGCTALQELNLSDTAITDAALEELAKLPSLRELYLAGAKVDGEGLRSLAKLPRLTHLSLARTDVGDEDLVALKGCQELEWLALSDCAITDKAVAQLKLLPKLRELKVDGTRLTDAGVEELRETFSSEAVVADPLDPQRLVARWVAELGGVAVAGEQRIAQTADLPRDAVALTAIDLADVPNVGAKTIDPLQHCPDLTSLDLSRTEITDEDLAAIAQLTRLEELHLAGTRVSDKGLAHLAALNSLRVLDLSETRVTGAGLAALQDLPNLSALRLNRCRVSDAAMETINRYPALVELSLAFNTSLSDSGIAKLTNLKKLQVLDVGGARITDAAMSTIGGFTDLRRLNLAGGKVSDASAEIFAQLPNLQSVNLGSTQVGDRTMTALAGLKNLQ
ncbi:MAG: protein kinase, partial [Pirellulales bacterium]